MSIVQQHGGPSAGGSTHRRSLPSLEVDWSNLPPDLLHLISKKLSDLADFVRFRAVCTRWLSAAPLSEHPPQLPWLLEWRDPFHSSNPSLLRFFLPSSSKTLTIDVPQASTHWLSGPSHGYIMAEDSQTFHRFLLNPLTKKQIYLPLLDAPADHPVCIDPDGEFVLVSENVTKKNWAFCKPGDEKWKVIEDRDCSRMGDAYYNGIYFTCGRYPQVTNVIDVSTQTVKYVIPPAEADTFSPLTGYVYLVESSGDILRVVKHDDSSLTIEECSFDIHKFDFGNGSPCWVKTDSIGDRMLFLDWHQGISLTSNGFSGFRGNCIYFFKARYEVGRGGFPLFILCRYDILEGRAQALACPIERAGTWFTPRLF